MRCKIEFHPDKRQYLGSNIHGSLFIDNSEFLFNVHVTGRVWAHHKSIQFHWWWSGWWKKVLLTVPGPNMDLKIASWGTMTWWSKIIRWCSGWGLWRSVHSGPWHDGSKSSNDGDGRIFLQRVAQVWYPFCFWCNALQFSFEFSLR